MKIILNNLKIISAALLFVAGLSTCDKLESAERAGKKIGQEAEKIGDKVGAEVDKIGTQSDQAGVAINDSEITTQVTAAIFTMPGLKTVQINVLTSKGIVKLSGTVDNRANRDRAIALAEAVNGVKAVENRLRIKSIKLI
ncbi:MAG: BON domain-containing protein [Candidatus Nitrotoga sp.]